MSEAVIVDAVRTPIGRGHKEKGYYKDTHPADLLGTGRRPSQLLLERFAQDQPPLRRRLPSASTHRRSPTASTTRPRRGR